MHLFVVSNKKATPSRELLLGACGRISPARGDKLRLRTSSIKKQHPFGCCFFGACGRIRTGDLLITSELLCQLSHTSILIRVGSSPRSVFSHRAATLQAMWYHTTNPRIRQLLFFTDPQRCRSRYFPRFPAGKYTG